MVCLRSRKGSVSWSKAKGENETGFLASAVFGGWIRKFPGTSLRVRSSLSSSIIRRHLLPPHLELPYKGDGGGEITELGETILTGRLNLELTEYLTHVCPISWFHQGEAFAGLPGFFCSWEIPRYLLENQPSWTLIKGSELSLWTPAFKCCPTWGKENNRQVDLQRNSWSVGHMVSS